MFSNLDRLSKKTPKDGIHRKEYINLLVDEFLNSHSIDAKCQVLANLANFAYDPLNFEYLRDAGALDVFLHQIIPKNTSDCPDLTIYASSGLCNLCLDPINADHIVIYDGINLLLNLLHCDDVEIKINAITTLILLADRIPKDKATDTEVIKLFLNFKNNTKDKRLSNLATVFLDDVCGSEAVKQYKETVGAIPLPQ